MLLASAFNQWVAQNQRKVRTEEEEKPGRLSLTCELSGGARKRKAQMLREV